METILTIDQSTFSSKVFIISDSGEILAGKSFKHQQIYPNSGWVEHDPEEIYENVVKAARYLKENHGDLMKTVKGIAITNQRETTILFDKETKKPVANAIVWQCRRTSDICDRLVHHEDRVEELTGLKINPYFSATKLKWLLDNSPKDRGQNYRFATVESWLIYKLTKGMNHVSDVTNASRTLLFNLDKLDWDDELCEIFSIPKYLLPELKNNDDIFGYSDIEGILERPVPITGVIGDSQAALFAQHCFTVGSMKVTLGTGSSLLINNGPTRPKPQLGVVAAMGWLTKGTPVYAREAIINCSGDTLNWLKDQLNVYQDENELNGIWDQLSRNDGVYLVPAFVGLSVPWWSNQARGAIVGLSRNHGFNHVLRAGLESIAYQIFDAASTLNYNPDFCLNVDGGAIKNKGLVQFLSDILNVDVKTSDNFELSAMGAFEIACEKLLEKRVGETAKQLYQPNMAKEMRQENIEGWHYAIEGVLAIARKKEDECYE